MWPVFLKKNLGFSNPAKEVLMSRYRDLVSSFLITLLGMHTSRFVIKHAEYQHKPLIIICIKFYKTYCKKMLKSAILSAVELHVVYRDVPDTGYVSSIRHYPALFEVFGRIVLPYPARYRIFL